MQAGKDDVHRGPNNDTDHLVGISIFASPTRKNQDNPHNHDAQHQLVLYYTLLPGSEQTLRAKGGPGSRQEVHSGKEYAQHGGFKLKESRQWLKLDPVGSTVRYERMKLCTGSV